MTKYQEINSTEALERAIKNSQEKPSLFFKHSSTCGISARAFGEFQKYLDAPESDLVNNYVVIIQDARSVSDELASLTGIGHESPQAIIVKDGNVVWNDSHMKLKKDALIEAVQKN